MYIIRSSGLVTLLLLLLFAPILRMDTPPVTPVKDEQTETVADDEPFSSDSIPVPFSQGLKELSFGQSSNTFGYMFHTLSVHDLRQQPYSIVRHLDEEFSIGMELETAPEQVEHLLSQIRIEGAATYEFTNMDVVPTRPVLRMTNMDPEVQVTLGDLPPILIVKMDPLRAVVEYEDQRSPSPGLFVPPSAHEWRGTVAIVPDQHPELVVRFNEEMEPSLHPDLPEGEWIDKYRYRLRLPRLEGGTHSERMSTVGSLSGFRSLEGNYVDLRSINFFVTQVKSADWLDMATDSRLGWSINDPLYETIVFSPDGESYVGTAIVGWPEGDATGSYYNFVLERRGKPAVTIEPYFYTNKLHQGSPVQWVDSSRVAYASQDSIFIYSLKDNTRTTLFSTADTNRYIHHAAYDPYSKEWSILTSTFDIEGLSEYGPLPVDLHLLDDSGTVIAHHREWSFSPFTGYMLLDNPIIPTTDGVFRTFYKDDKAYTQFESRDGSERELPGIIQYADEHLAILLEDVQVDEGVEVILHLWGPGQEQPTAAAKAPGKIIIAGSQMIAESDGDYYKYDAASDRWVFWKSTRTISLSRQTFSGMYKGL